MWNKNLKKDIGETYYNLEINEERINEIIEKKIKTIQRAIPNRKQRKKNFDDLALRMSEIKNSIVHYKIDIVVLRDRIVEFEG